MFWGGREGKSDGTICSQIFFVANTRRRKLGGLQEEKNNIFFFCWWRSWGLITQDLVQEKMILDVPLSD